MVHETDRVRTNKIRALDRDVLLRDWDPIGISDIPEAKDEYDAYADVVLGMLINENATAEDIANYLFKMATAIKLGGDQPRATCGVHRKDTLEANTGDLIGILGVLGSLAFPSFSIASAASMWGVERGQVHARPPTVELRSSAGLKRAGNPHLRQSLFQGAVQAITS